MDSTADRAAITHVARLEAQADAATARHEALAQVTQVIRDARQVPGVSQQDIAKAVLDGMGLIIGENPFVDKRSGGMGWGGR